jgi:predicted TIM-barrel fold metal-dependent hydrolase
MTPQGAPRVSWSGPTDDARAEPFEPFARAVAAGCSLSSGKDKWFMLITSDCHIAAPYELTDELPERYREYFPHLEYREDGAYVINPLQIGGRGMTMGTGGGRPLEPDLADRARAASTGVADTAAGYAPEELLADLARDSVSGAVLISRVAYRNDCPPDAQIAYCRLMNDYLADVYREHLGRLAPGILLPFLDPAECAKELERAAGLGLRPGLLPDAIWNQPYHDASWEPLWEVASALEIPLTLHVGSLRNRPVGAKADGAGFRPYPGLSIVGFYGQAVLMGETLGWLAFSGVFERHPNLHIVMTEGYAGWLAFAMQFFDHHFQESRFTSAIPFPGFGKPDLQAPPSYYLKRQSHATFMWDPVAIANRGITGTDCLLWGNDYPHPEGSFPFSREWLDKQFADVPADEADAVTRGNAAALFRISV